MSQFFMAQSNCWHDIWLTSRLQLRWTNSKSDTDFSWNLCSNWVFSALKAWIFSLSWHFCSSGFKEDANGMDLITKSGSHILPSRDWLDKTSFSNLNQDWWSEKMNKSYTVSFKFSFLSIRFKINHEMLKNFSQLMIGCFKLAKAVLFLKTQ